MRKRKTQNTTGREAKYTRSTKRRAQGKKTNQEVEDAKVSNNDPAWYAADPAILRDAASIPFSWPTGASSTIDKSIWSGVGNMPYGDIPGILSFRTYPVVGTATTGTDPINVASQLIYSFVRHANSGHSNYDAPDLMLYILAMANFYSFLVWCQRSYGYALTYDQRNRYLPKELLIANNVDPDDLINNLANFRFWINALIAKAASFAVPATMSIFSRMSFLYSNVYIEGTTIKDQLYQYIPDGFYQFNINSGTSLGELVYQQIDRTNLMTVSDIMTYGDSLFNAIWSQEDFGIMSGDILKAYGDRIIKLASIPEAYFIVPQFDPMVLTQLKNTKMVTVVRSDITQTGTNANLVHVVAPRAYATGDLLIDGQTMSSSGAANMNDARLRMLKDYKVLTVDTDNPTPEVVIEATRLMYGYDAYLGYARFGTECIVSVLATYEPGVAPIEVEQINGWDNTSIACVNLYNKWQEVLRNFHYMPQWSIATWTTAGAANLHVSQFFDKDNFAVLSNEDVIKMNTAATINLYSVPSVGKMM